jgi:hypothetical protein
MKVALCFLINYDHILNKEQIWKEWIEPNKDIINVYFYYKDPAKITSEWINQNKIPFHKIVPTSYFQVVQAYLISLKHAIEDIDINSRNEWFFFLTDSCCPVISPQVFRKLFFKYHTKSIMSWRKPWWRVDFCKRANLHKLPEKLRLGHEAWFALCREHAVKCVTFPKKEPVLYNLITMGGLANESIFAIILEKEGMLKEVINHSINNSDWDRPSSSTSPHVFSLETLEDDKAYLDELLSKNKRLANMSQNNDINIKDTVFFIRKITVSFPDNLLTKYWF